MISANAVMWALELLSLDKLLINDIVLIPLLH